MYMLRAIDEYGRVYIKTFDTKPDFIRSLDWFRKSGHKVEAFVLTQTWERYDEVP